MKLLQKVLATLATAGFVMVQPAAAHAAAAKALPVARSASVTAQDEKLAGTGGHVILILAILGGLLLLAEVTGLIDVFGNDDELPHSP